LNKLNRLQAGKEKNSRFHLEPTVFVHGQESLGIFFPGYMELFWWKDTWQKFFLFVFLISNFFSLVKSVNVYFQLFSSTDNQIASSQMALDLSTSTGANVFFNFSEKFLKKKCFHFFQRQFSTLKTCSSDHPWKF